MSPEENQPKKSTEWLKGYRQGRADTQAQLAKALQGSGGLRKHPAIRRFNPTVKRGGK